MSDNQDSQAGAVNQTAPPESADKAAAAPDTPVRTAEQEVDDARQQLAEAQKRLEAAQTRLNNAQEAAKEHIQPLLQTEPVKEPEKAAPEENLPATPEPAEPAPPAPPARAGFCNGLFMGLAAIAPIAILVIMACMAWPVFLEPDKSVFCPPEVNSLTAFLHCLATNSWFTPTGLENGAFTHVPWPGFIWYIGLFNLIPGLVETGLLLPIASFTATFLAVLGVWALCLAARFSAKAAFAGSIILLCAPLFAPMPDFAGPAALAAALMLFAMVFFCHGWLYASAWFSLPLAFILTALAGLTGGLLHFAVPLIASIIFLIWRGNIKRVQSLDALFGFILMLALLGCWYGAINIEKAPPDYIASLMHQAVRLNWAMPLQEVKPAVAGLAGLLPWLLLIICVSWVRVLAKAGKSLGDSRRSNGSAFVWVATICALVISICVPGFHPAAFAIACLGAVLLGKAFANLSVPGNRFFFLLAGICTILAGLGILGLTFEQTQNLLLPLLPFTPPIPDLAANLQTLSGLRIVAGILILGGLLSFIFVHRYKGFGGLILAMVTVIVMCQPARLILVPELTAMKGSPLVHYREIEAQVNKAMQPPAIPELAPAPQETAPAAPEAAPATETPSVSETPAPAVPAEPEAVPEPAAPAQE